jgi:hypothetical protein
MNIQRIAIAVTAMNLVIMTILLTQMRPAHAQKQDSTVPQVIKAHSLEIVDNRGKVRASITIQPPVTVDGKLYPETALFRLITPQGKPAVKLGADEFGSGLTLTNAYDEGVLLHGRNDSSFLRITQKGKQRVMAP